MDTDGRRSPRIHTDRTSALTRSYSDEPRQTFLWDYRSVGHWSLRSVGVKEESKLWRTEISPSAVPFVPVAVLRFVSVSKVVMTSRAALATRPVQLNPSLKLRMT